MRSCVTNSDGFELFVMTLISLENNRQRFAAVPWSRRDTVVSKERVSDVWPDWATELNEGELTEVAEKNRPSVVLWEALRAIVISVGMVILLMVAADHCRSDQARDRHSAPPSAGQSPSG
jgi:hypothetical protein